MLSLALLLRLGFLLVIVLSDACVDPQALVFLIIHQIHDAKQETVKNSEITEAATPTRIKSAIKLMSHHNNVYLLPIFCQIETSLFP